MLTSFAVHSTRIGTKLQYSNVVQYSRGSNQRLHAGVAIEIASHLDDILLIQILRLDFMCTVPIDP
jgi:hypothetical protein